MSDPCILYTLGPNSYLISIVDVLLCEAADPQHLSSFEKRRQRSLVHVDLAMIDEFDKRVQISPGYVLKDYHRVLTWG